MNTSGPRVPALGTAGRADAGRPSAEDGTGPLVRLTDLVELVVETLGEPPGQRVVIGDRIARITVYVRAERVVEIPDDDVHPSAHPGQPRPGEVGLLVCAGEPGQRLVLGGAVRAEQFLLQRVEPL